MIELDRARHNDGRIAAAKKQLAIIAAIVLFVFVHEGKKAILSIASDEYRSFRGHPHGLEVIYKTPVAEREGLFFGHGLNSSDIIGGIGTGDDTIRYKCD
jgi:hypothetical protein